MKLMLTLVGSLIWTTSAFAQPVTVAVFLISSSDPNTDSPVAPPVVYPSPLCNQPPLSERPLIIDPVKGYYTDPSRAARDCQIDLRQQISALPAVNRYRAAVKIGTDLYGQFSTAFAVTAASLIPAAPPHLRIVGK